MAGVKDEVTGLLQGLQRTEPRLHRILELLSGDIQTLQNQINPIIAETGGPLFPDPNPAPPFNFAAVPFPDYLQFTWEPIDEIGRTFEIREHFGALPAVWETASFIVRTPSLSANINPVLTGAHTYLIKSINRDNVYSTQFTELTVVIPEIGLIVVTAQVIDNNVLLRWNTPSTAFRIAEYALTKDDVFIGVNTGNFSVIFEMIGGSFKYGVTAVDIAGNLSAEAFVIAIVAQPPDFELFDTLLWDTGSPVQVLVNAKKYVYGTGLADPGAPQRLFTVNRVVLPVDIAISYQNHFIVPSYASPQAQITAGFPYLMEPAINGVGSIQVKWDLGSIITNIIINIDTTYEIIDGNVAVTLSTIYSNDDSSYSSPVAGSQVFMTSARYIKVTFTGTTVDTASFLDLSDLSVRLDVKRENDGGVVSALSTDATGTVVTFNKLFRDIDSITGTALVTEGAVVVIDFTDAPNPTQFKVLVFDYAGNRISCSVRWAARGII